jgi:ABC-2 type transport system permease protein
MRNLGIVVKFEITRTLKKPSFWVAALLAPIGLVAYILFAGMNGYNASKIAEEGSQTDNLKLALLDEAKVTNPELVKKAGLKQVANKNQAIEQVKNGQLNVFYYIPADFAKKPAVSMYTQTDENTLFSDYSTTLRAVLQQSIEVKASPAELVILNGAYTFNTTAFENGEERNRIGEMIIPIIALAIFYILICIFGNRLMMSTLEEKENRISEMILTSVGGKALIIGKIISLIALGFLQITILAIPAIIGLLNAKNVSFGGINLADILPTVVLNPYTIIVSLLLLVFSYILFTGLNVTVGSLVPNAREASGFVSVIMILVIMPIFFVSSFISPTPDATTYALSYFPLSAPVALLMRNAFGTLPPVEAIAGIVLLVITATFMIWLAIRAFRVGTMEYQSRVSIKRLLRSGRE